MRPQYSLILLLCSLTVFAEQPIWYSESQRAANFPKEQYFTGIAYGEVHANEDDGSAMERMKATARVDALSTISINVQNEVNSHLRDVSFESVDGWMEEIAETFDSHTRTRINIENIPGLQTEAWKNPNSNEVIAFAYIKKSTLCRQMEKQIIIGLTRIETILENTEQLLTNGQKIQARETLYKAIPLFNEVEQAQRVLIVVDSFADEDNLQLEETKKLKQLYMLLSERLRTGVSIHLKFEHDKFEVDYNILAKQIEKELSNNGCSLVTSPSQADWVITLQVATETEVMRENSTDQFVKISLSGSVFDVRKQVSYGVIKSERDGASVKNGGYKLAAEKILNRGDLIPITKDIMEILKSK